MTATAGDSAAAMMVAGTATPLGAAAVARTTQKPISSHPLYDVDDEGHHTLSLIGNCRAQPNCVRGRAAAPTFRKPSLTAATFTSPPSETVSPSAAAAMAAGIAAAAAEGVPVRGSRGRDSGGGSGREGKGPDVDSLLFDLDYRGQAWMLRLINACLMCGSPTGIGGSGSGDPQIWMTGSKPLFLTSSRTEIPSVIFR